jgi:hypothetical protein
VLATGPVKLDRCQEHMKRWGFKRIHEVLKQSLEDGERLTRVIAVVTVDVAKISVVVVSTWSR